MSEFEFAPRSECVCGARLITQSPYLRKIFTWGEVCFRRCPSCESWCQDPQITVPSIAAWYDSDLYQGSEKKVGQFYANYLAEEPNRAREAQARWTRELAPMLGKRAANILEIGCATGSLLSAARDQGHQVHGIDLSVRFASFAKEINNLNVEVTDIAQARFTQASFDLILLFGTVSNIPSLQENLRKVHEWLKPGGHVVGNFPAADSWSARILRHRYWMYAPSVNTFLSSLGCQRALTRAGFGKIQIFRDVQQPSWNKLAIHSRIPGSLRFARLLRLQGKSIPFPLPIPGIRRFHAIKES